jgi:hypothetical protein
MPVPSGMEDAELSDLIFESSQLQSPLTELFALLDRAQLSLSFGHAYFQVLYGMVKRTIPGHLGLHSPVRVRSYFLFQRGEVGAGPMQEL